MANKPSAVQREQNLRLMNEDMRHLNHEDGWLVWITYGMPDAATDWDFKSVAGREDRYNEVEQVYWGVRNEYAKYGWWNSATYRLDYVPQYQGNGDAENERK